MRTLIEKLYEQKNGEQGLYRMFSPDEIRLPMGFPGIGVKGRIDCPGPKLPTEGIPLEVMLGYQTPQSLYVMYSFGINDPTFGSSFGSMSDLGLPMGGYGPEPIDPYKSYDRLMRKKDLDFQTSFEQIEQPYTYKTSHNGEGFMTIHRETGDCLHTFQDGGAHIDLSGNHLTKLGIERMGPESYIKDLGGYF